MTSAKRFLLIALSFAIALSVFAVFTPRIAHAITATLVQVVNTSANPVPSADASLKFEASVCSQSGTIAPATNSCAPGKNVFVVPTTTTTGTPVKRLVIDYVSGTCSNFNNNALQLKTITIAGPPTPDSVNGGSSFTYYVATGPGYSYVNDSTWGPPIANFPETDYIFSQPTHITFNAGDTVSVGVLGFLPSRASAFDYYCIDQLAGYLVTQ
jgi:hypothetical protein